MLTVCTRYVNILYQNVSDKSIENQDMILRVFFAVIDKVGLVGEMQRYNMRKSCDLDEDAEEGCSEDSSSHVESESDLSSDEEQAIEVCYRGAGLMKFL